MRRFERDGKWRTKVMRDERWQHKAWTLMKWRQQYERQRRIRLLWAIVGGLVGLLLWKLSR